MHYGDFKKRLKDPKWQIGLKINIIEELEASTDASGVEDRKM